MIQNTLIEPRGFRPGRGVMIREGLRSLRDWNCFAHGFRGCRFAQPPANGWHPFGMTGHDEPRGFGAISRWLKSEATTPPDDRRIHFRIPEGCQRMGHGEVRGVSQAGLRSFRDRMIRPTPFRGCRFAQPPANGWHPFGMTGHDEPRGFGAISRWLRREATIPPVSNGKRNCIPEVCQHAPRMTARVDGHLKKKGAVWQ